MPEAVWNSDQTGIITGPEHDKLFMVEALLNGKKIGEGSGRSKKLAEQQAAYQALISVPELAK